MSWARAPVTMKGRHGCLLRRKMDVQGVGAAAREDFQEEVTSQAQVKEQGQGGRLAEEEWPQRLGGGVSPGAPGAKSSAWLELGCVCQGVGGI